LFIWRSKKKERLGKQSLVSLNVDNNVDNDILCLWLEEKRE
jgi:hypothetical protein